MSCDPTSWYRRVYRWGQTNLTEIDPTRYDASWWREHWRRTRVQGVIVNAGGIVAYYPSKYPLHYRAVGLHDRDFYSEIVAAAREQGLAVLARMDSNRANATFYFEHPNWLTVDAEGRPYRAEERYIACVNSAYYPGTSTRSRRGPRCTRRRLITTCSCGSVRPSTRRSCPRSPNPGPSRPTVSCTTSKSATASRSTMARS